MSELLSLTDVAKTYRAAKRRIVTAVDGVSLTLGADQLEAVVRHGAKVVDLEGAASGKALLQDVTWDTFFHQVLHVDLLRVMAGEKVTVEVPIELKGTPASAAASTKASIRASGIVHSTS